MSASQVLFLAWIGCGLVELAWRQIVVWGNIRRTKKLAAMGQPFTLVQTSISGRELAIALLCGPLVLALVTIVSIREQRRLMRYRLFKEEATRRIAEASTTFQSRALVVRSRVCDGGCPRLLTVTVPYRDRAEEPLVFCSNACATRVHNEGLVKYEADLNVERDRRFPEFVER